MAAESLSAPTEPLVRALAAVTIACEDPAAMADLLVSAVGWELRARGALDEPLQRAWGIAPGSAGDDFVLLAAPGTDRGMLRIVRGTERRRSRPVAARWAGAEILVMRGIDTLFEGVSAHPAFTTLHAPFDMDWSEFGSNVHRAFIGQAPGGTHLAFTMALTQPEGRAFPEAAGPVGHVFDVPLITADFAAESRCLQHTLGMAPFLSSRFDGGPWHELWSLPPGTPVALDILKGDAPGTGLGGIELQGYPAAVIDPDAPPVDALDGGACLVTYTTADIDTAWQRIGAELGPTVFAEPVVIAAPPYDGRRTFCCCLPGGARLEICEL
ncbi:MAG: hypothetical protein JSV45_06965 [Chromatiales bacterium]|nr:MAG: hypothetical protein JSV45_06965 [Chromatiales bacterium]